MKLNAAASESGRRYLNGNNPESLREAYEIGRLVEQRITERATLINFKRARECRTEKDIINSEDRYSSDNFDSPRFRERGESAFFDYEKRDRERSLDMPIGR